MKRRFNIIVLLFFLHFTSFIYSQELPPIEIFTPEDYHGENQNWMISQTLDKNIYVANNQGLLEYNGTKWKMYASPNNTIIRAVAVVDDRIYTGCYMEFGYWSKNTFGNLLYNSLVPELKTKMIDDEHIWNIITLEDWILFQSHDRIYFYNFNDKDFTIINSNNTITKVFNINNNIYYHVDNEGVYKINEGKSILVIDEEVFNGDDVINIFPANKDLLIQTFNSGFYFLKDEKIVPWNIPATKTLKNITVYNSIQLKDKSFVLGTISNGIIYLSADGNIVYYIDQNNGLSNNTALSLFEDTDDNIWIGLDNGINCINLKSFVDIFNDDQGKIGMVYDSKIFNEYLYLGTNHGLFFKKINTTDPFKFIDGTSGQVWNLHIYNDELFCGHHYGSFLIEKNKAVLIADTPGTWGFREVPKIKNTLLQGNYSGLNLIQKSKGKWSYKNKLIGFDNSARYFEFLNSHEIFVSHEYKGVIKLNINRDYSKVTSIQRDSVLGIGKNSSLTKYNHQLLYAFEKGVFVYDTIKNRFIIDSLLSPIVCNGNYISGKIVVDQTKKLWGFTEESINYISINNLTNKFQLNTISIPSKLRKGMIGYENIEYVDNEKYLLGTSDGYITLDLSNIQNPTKHSVSINNIQLKIHEKPNQNIDIYKSGDFKFSQNSITVNYNVPEFKKYITVKYQYKLKGLYEGWSKWSDQSETTFENLPFGSYNFIVRAKTNNNITDEANYEFTVNRPWLLSNLAIVMYIISILILFGLIHRTYKKYYNRQNIHKQIKNERLIMQMKNENLNHEIESKNKELAISTMSLIKKNEVLGSIKKELKKISCEPKEAFPIINLIDKNINNSKDWKFFEEAFNNADKHFLDKVKKIHPNLTSNDLRFCAYLRLNLSSKEIAPLLNISVRSVEIKRYRLRKKMNLSHDDGLIDHILEI